MVEKPLQREENTGYKMEIQIGGDDKVSPEKELGKSAAFVSLQFPDTFPTKPSCSLFLIFKLWESSLYPYIIFLYQRYGSLFPPMNSVPDYSMTAAQ